MIENKIYGYWLNINLFQISNLWQLSHSSLLLSHWHIYTVVEIIIDF